MAKLSENGRIVYDYVLAHESENITAKDIAEATGLNIRTVNGVVTSAFQKKGLMERIEAEVELADGSHDKVKFVKLTDDGRAFDPDAVEEAE